MAPTVLPYRKVLGAQAVLVEVVQELDQVPKVVQHKVLLAEELVMEVQEVLVRRLHHLLMEEVVAVELMVQEEVFLHHSSSQLQKCETQIHGCENNDVIFPWDSVAIRTGNRV